MKPLVSIVIPCYNYENYITECIQSAVRQVGPSVEVIVVDDCSTDSSLAMINRCAAELTFFAAEITVIKNSENRGSSYCRNKGIIEAKGKYIVHIDADDVLITNGIEKRLKYFEKDPTLDLVHGKAFRLRAVGNQWVLDGYNETSKIHAQGIMVKRSVYERFGLYYEPLRSKMDKEMSFRWGIHPVSKLPVLIKAKAIDDFVAQYRKHSRQLHRTRKADPVFGKEIAKIFKKRIKQLRTEGVTKKNTRFI